MKGGGGGPHYIVTFEHRDDGVYVECACGWANGPYSGIIDAAEGYGDHRGVV